MTPNWNREASEAENLRDFGFGSYVGGKRQLRLLNHDGSFNVERSGGGLLGSLYLYHHLLTMSWGRFHLTVVLSYLAVNVLFAFAYLLLGSQALSGPLDSSFLSAFFRAFYFSVQTISTIGYGHIVPVGVTVNLLVMLEALTGLLGFALVTGMLFARFSRPSARIRFSHQAVVAPYQNISGFMFRIANERRGEILDLDAEVAFSYLEDVDGVPRRRYGPLRLEREHVAFFPLSWTLVHPIDDESPLHGLTHADLVRREAEFLIQLTGIDESFSQTVYARSSYRAEEVIFGARFVKIYEQLQADGVIRIDLRRLHEIEVARL